MFANRADIRTSISFDVQLTGSSLGGVAAAFERAFEIVD